MLTDPELDKVIQILNLWPGGMGCILLPSDRTNRGYKSADWGWRGRKFGNFDYSVVPSFGESALLCPVTAVGVMRYAEDFSDHMQAYKDIRETLEAALKIKTPKAKLVYNYMLSHFPRSLCQIFWHYRYNAELEGVPLIDVVGGDFVEAHVESKGKPLNFPLYVKGTNNTTIRIIDKDQKFYRETGLPVTPIACYIGEYHAH